MKNLCSLTSPFVRVLALALAAATPMFAADSAVITVTNNLAAARPGEVITVPYADLLKIVPGLQMFHFRVKNAATGAEVPSQVTNFEHDHRGVNYDELVFQHDFAAGERTARFVIEKSAPPVPPYPAKVFARYVPERYDDFAFENDRIGHRIYGVKLETAPGEMLRSSGIDIWVKRVRYPIIDRWYLKGHDQFHRDDGEGFDIYSIGPARGAGGLGVWDGQKLWNSINYRSWKVLANGPIRAVFELGYEPWDANGVKVSETKRITVDAGRNLHLLESTFSFEGAPELTIGIGVTKHGNVKNSPAQNEQNRVLSIWEDYSPNGNLGVGVVLAPDMNFAGFAEDAAPRPNGNGNLLLLARVKPGEPLRYLAGAGWDQSGDFTDQKSWETYLAAFAQRLASPVQVSVAAQ